MSESKELKPLKCLCCERWFTAVVPKCPNCKDGPIRDREAELERDYKELQAYNRDISQQLRDARNETSKAKIEAKKLELEVINLRAELDIVKALARGKDDE